MPHAQNFIVISWRNDFQNMINVPGKTFFRTLQLVSQGVLFINVFKNYSDGEVWSERLEKKKLVLLLGLSLFRRSKVTSWVAFNDFVIVPGGI